MASDLSSRCHTQISFIDNVYYIILCFISVTMAAKVEQPAPPKAEENGFHKADHTEASDSNKKNGPWHVNLPGNVWDFLVITIAGLGVALVVFAAARNTLTW